MMTPLEQYMKTRKVIRGRFEEIASKLPGKAKLRADRQWLTVPQMAKKYQCSVGALAEVLSRYGITSGMRYTYQGTLRKYQ